MAFIKCLPRYRCNAFWHCDRDQIIPSVKNRFLNPGNSILNYYIRNRILIFLHIINFRKFSCSTNCECSIICKSIIYISSTGSAFTTLLSDSSDAETYTALENSNINMVSHNSKCFFIARSIPPLLNSGIVYGQRELSRLPPA